MIKMKVYSQVRFIRINIYFEPSLYLLPCLLVPSCIYALPLISRRNIQKSFLDEMTRPVLRMGQILQRMGNRMVRYVAGGNEYPRVMYPVQPGNQENIFPAYLGKYYMYYMLLLFFRIVFKHAYYEPWAAKGEIKMFFPPTAFNTLNFY